jgi:PKD repeat protein
MSPHRQSDRRSTLQGIAAACLLVVLALGGCGLFPNDPPIAIPEATPQRGSAPLAVVLDGGASYDPDGRLVGWGWLLGDGASETGPVVSHRYAEPGRYVVRLTVRDNRGATAVASVQIEVLGPNEAPRAVMDFDPESGAAPLLVTFDGSGSSDEDGEVVWWAWSFGDGGTAVGSTVAHRYTAPGTYTVRLTVTDDAEGQGSVEAEIVIEESGSLPRSFEWEYGGETMQWTVEIPEALYQEYQQRPRALWGLRDYDEFVLDPLDDAYLKELTNQISARVGGGLYETMECAFHFTQAAVRYAYDRSGFEHPRYPLESLVDGIGDCEDTAILYASLIRTLGHGAMMVAVDTNRDGHADHMIALAPVDQSYADAVSCSHGCVKSFWTYGSQLYAFAETTGEPDLMGYYFELGCDPWGLESCDFMRAWDVSSAVPADALVKWNPEP